MDSPDDDVVLALRAELLAKGSKLLAKCEPEASPGRISKERAGRRFRRAREMAGYGLDRLAAYFVEVGFDRGKKSTIQGWEKGEREIPMQAIDHLPQRMHTLWNYLNEHDGPLSRAG